LRKERKGKGKRKEMVLEGKKGRRNERGTMSAIQRRRRRRRRGGELTL